jgi:hypothetical protein
LGFGVWVWGLGFGVWGLGFGVGVWGRGLGSGSGPGVSNVVRVPQAPGGDNPRSANADYWY